MQATTSIIRQAFFIAVISLSCIHTAVAQTETGSSPTATGETQSQPTKEGDEAEIKRLSTLVVRLYGEGKYEEATPSARKALELSEKLPGPDHPLVATTSGNLAALYLAQKKFGEAETLYQRALKIAEKAHGPESGRIVPLLKALADVHYALDHKHQTEDLLKRALAIQEKTLGENDDETAGTLLSLAGFYYRTGKSREAVSYYQRVIAIREKALAPPLGPKHREVGELIGQCACALLLDGRNRENKEVRELVNRGGKILLGLNPDSTDPADDILTKAITRVQPRYPAEAKSAHIMGTILLIVEVDESGAVTGVKPLCGPPYLTDVSVQAAWQWRFKPTMVSGQPIKFAGFLTFTFTLQ
ncbi:MAG TPA: TonB family protein [Blastocatellia bacterium]|nr:TonB family protein [Blastocatellia bacterium]